MHLAPATAAEKPAAYIRGPRSHVVRNLLEVAHLPVEQQDLLAAALSKARKHHDRPLCHLLEAAMLTDADLGAEVDHAGTALGQIGAFCASFGETGDEAWTSPRRPLFSFASALADARREMVRQRLPFPIERRGSTGATSA